MPYDFKRVTFRMEPEIDDPAHIIGYTISDRQGRRVEFVNSWRVALIRWLIRHLLPWPSDRVWHTSKPNPAPPSSPQSYGSWRAQLD